MPPLVAYVFLSCFGVFCPMLFACLGWVAPAGDSHDTDASHWGNSRSRVQWRGYHARRFSCREVSSFRALVATAIPLVFFDYWL